ncbi:MAG: adenylyltransferase/cytidyltransferase family protein, partial [Streptococcus salivarius]
MKITYINDYKDIHQEKETVLVLGYFDALHRGHKVLFDKARQIADDKQLEVAVLTFNESPQLTFQRYTDDLLLHITAPQRRCDLFEAYGTDQLYLTDFNSDFARTSSDDFIARYIKRLKAQEVVVGFDYKFGHHRTDVDYLARNFSGNVHVIEEQQSDGEKISSTRVRQLIREG